MTEDKICPDCGKPMTYRSVTGLLVGHQRGELECVSTQNATLTQQVAEMKEAMKEAARVIKSWEDGYPLKDPTEFYDMVKALTSELTPAGKEG